jgi:glutaminyl-tRNA synthetase
MYDFTHCISDALEGITHSLCTLEFQDNRELYDWVLENITIDENLNGEQGKLMPRQIEFGRLNLKYTVLSKRKLIQLVEEKHVTGWDDPRLPTLAGIKRRGYTANSIRQFCNEIGITKKDALIEMTILENAIRHDLEGCSKRAFAVLKPLKITLTNYDVSAEAITVKNHPKDESYGTRTINFGRELYIDHDDFMLDPPENFFRLAPGREVRLRYGYAITCNEVIKGEDGNVIELLCTYDPLSAKGKTADGRKIKGIIHWVNANDAVDAEVRLYDRLFKEDNPAGADDFLSLLNPDSLQIIEGAKLEPSLAKAKEQDRFQFERVGYFSLDADSTSEKLVYNRTVSLRDSWGK